MNIIIAGGRDFDDYDLLKNRMDEAKRRLDARGVSITVVTGKAKGADDLGQRWAKENGLPVLEFPANWEKHGKSGGYRRNAEMAEIAQGLVAFWDQQSKGTRHMIAIARAKKLAVWIIHY